MAWSWSHSAEGMQNVRDNIALLPRDDLEVIYAEWKACDAVYHKAIAEREAMKTELRELEYACDENGDSTAWSDEEYDRVQELRDELDTPEPTWDSEAFDSDAYATAIEDAKFLNYDQLAEYVAERAEEHAMCDNGGFDAWVCPSGCHTVSFSSREELEQEETE